MSLCGRSMTVSMRRACKLEVRARDGEKSGGRGSAKAESIPQTRDEESEQLRSTCDRLRNQEELDELTDRYDELVNDQSVALPQFGDVTTPNAGTAPRSRSGSPKGSTSPVKLATSSAPVTETN